MNIVEKDQNLAEFELKQKELAIAEQKDRDLYFEALKKNKRFQKHFIAHLKKELNDLENIMNIPSGSFEEMGQALIVARAARKKLDDILKPFL